MNTPEERLGVVVASLQSSGPIPLRKVKRWMRSPSLEVRAAAAELITDQRYAGRVLPPPNWEELGEMLIPFYECCLMSGREGEWVQNRSTLGWEVMGWFRSAPRDMSGGRTRFLEDLKEMLVRLRKTGSAEAKEAVVYAVLEHILEEPRWRVYFKDWQDDPVLRVAYEQAMEWAVDHTLEDR